jgi:hypothetical protein
MLGFPFLKAQNDVKTLAYWLSNLSALTVLLQRSFKTTRTALSTPQRRRFSSERIFHTSQTSNAGLASLGQSVVGATGLPQVEAKYPALLFKQQLVDLIEKVYGMISDSVKKELNPLLELCIQVLLPALFWEQKKLHAAMLRWLNMESISGSTNFSLKPSKKPYKWLGPTEATSTLVKHRGSPLQLFGYIKGEPCRCKIIMS